MDTIAPKFDARDAQYAAAAQDMRQAGAWAEGNATERAATAIQLLDATLASQAAEAAAISAAVEDCGKLLS